MADVAIPLTLKDVNGDTPGTAKARTLRYRRSGTGQVSGGNLYPAAWAEHTVTATASTVTIEQGVYYDIQALWMLKRWSNKAGPAAATSTFATWIA